VGTLEERVSPVLSVAPRIPKYDSRHLLIYDGTRVLLERTGEVHPAHLFPGLLLSEDPGIVICENALQMLAHLNYGVCSRRPGWQFRTSFVKRTKWRQIKGNRPVTQGHTLVSWFGWRTFWSNGTTAHTHYHYPVDPIVLANCAIHRLIPHEVDSDARLAALLAWGMDMREWCRENDLKVSTSAGSLAIQLLTDPRFYPESRRKVPRATNDRARQHLFGNHYELHTEPRIFQNGYYLDMKSAHHYCASKVALPNANTLNARGKFREPLGESEDQPFTRSEPIRVASGCAAYRQLTTRAYGLLQVRIDPLRPHERFTLPYLKKPGIRIAWIYTNELELVRELGGQILGIEAAWVSFERDDGIRKYAEWAMAENRAMSSERKKWCKPTLLAAYGMLAHRPTAPTIGYHQSDKGIRQPVPVPGGGVLEMNIHQAQKETESRICNVIHRGMIEAEVRVRVIRMARELAAQGTEVLALYADSVIVNSDLPLTFLPEPWDIKTELTQLEFFNAVSFHSKEMTKLPGIPDRLDTDRISHYKMMAALAGSGRTPLRQSL